MNILEKIPYDRIGEFPIYQRWLAIGAIHLLVFTGYFLLSYKGTGESIDGLVANINGVEQELKKNRLRRKKLPHLKEKIDGLNFKLLISRTQLPGSKEIPELLEQISNLGTNSGLEFLLFKPQSVSAKDFYTKVPVQMKVSGTFHETVDFFDKLGNFPRIVNISKIKMGGAKSKKKGAIIQSSMTVTTFMYTGGKDIATEKKKNYLNNRFGFSLQYKNDWVTEDTQGGDIAVTITAPKAEKGYNPNTIIKVRDRKRTDGDFFTAAIEKDKQEGNIFKDDYHILSEKDKPVDNFRSYQVVSTYKKDSIKLREMVTYISKDKGILHVLVSTAPDVQFERYEALFNEEINSFWVHSDEDFKKIGEERFWTAPLSTYDFVGKRDPFYSLLIADEKIVRVEVEEDDDLERSKTPLELFDTLSLKLVGIIWGEEGKGTALIETTDGKGYVVREGMFIGRKRGVIRDITVDSVIVEERRKYRIGEKTEIKKENVVLKLNVVKK